MALDFALFFTLVCFLFWCFLVQKCIWYKNAFLQRKAKKTKNNKNTKNKAKSNAIPVFLVNQKTKHFTM